MNAARTITPRDILATLVTAVALAVSATAGTVAQAAPGAPPGPPTQVSAAPLGAATKVRWEAPNDPGGNPIAGYVAQIWDRERGGGKKPLATCTTTTLTCTISGLTPGTTYWVDVIATNGKEGRASDPRVSVTPYTPASTLAGTIYFASKQDGLTEAARAEIEALLPLFANAAAVRVDGYVQRAKAGQSEPASQLSKRRAIAVANYLGSLITAQGWDVVITVKGRGQPAVDPGKSTARRAEIVITGVR